METQSQWKGSLRTAKMVAEQIATRWGNDEVQNNEWKAARTVNLFYIKQVDKIKNTSEVES